MVRRTTRSARAVLAGVAALGPLRGAENRSGPATIPELRAAIEAVLKETRTPGAGIAIVSHDQVEWAAGVGLADVAANRPVTVDTLFRIGSVSKAFAAFAALQLQEEGKLKLTDTVRQWVPDVAFANPWEATDPVRLVHLMEHTAGFDDLHYREFALHGPNVLLNDALAYGADSRVSRWRPGSRMSYSNSGPAVLAAVVEKVTGRRFEDYVQEHFFQPLHMDGASYFNTPDVQRRRTTLYHEDGVTPYPYYDLALRASGAINASAMDMGNYVRFCLQRGRVDGRQILSPSSLRRMETTETMPSARLGPMAGYGLYNCSIPVGAYVFRGHTGGLAGAVTALAYLPGGGGGYAVMLNKGDADALRRIEDLVRQYVLRDLTPPPVPPEAPVPAEVAQHYAGYYQGVTPRQQLWYFLDRLLYIKRLSFTAKGLSATSYGIHRESWIPLSERLFRREGHSIATLALLPDADGEILIEQYGAIGTMKKVSALRVWSQFAAVCLILLLVLTTLGFAPIWGLRLFLDRRRGAGPLAVRAWPLLSVLLAIAFLGLFWKDSNDWDTAGVRSWLTIGILLASLAFPVAAVAGLAAVIRAHGAVMNRIAYWHSASVAVAMTVVAAYFAYWGLFGLCLWR